MAKKTTKKVEPKVEFNDVPVPKTTVHILTVDELYEELKNARKNGLGNKKILLSDDDEGNGYHYMFYSITPATEFEYGLPATAKAHIDDYVILG